MITIKQPEVINFQVLNRSVMNPIQNTVSELDIEIVEKFLRDRYGVKTNLRILEKLQTEIGVSDFCVITEISTRLQITPKELLEILCTKYFDFVKENKHLFSKYFKKCLIKQAKKDKCKRKIK